ncbi:MAG: DNA replication and repair protein RecF [Nitrospiraceae bacterium]|nr:DNA replication and repair protein RecF [Nitrospiraceae bacterium]
MYAEFVHITDFRNIASMRLEPAQLGVTAITGSNGQGKSSIIEAISYALSGRSFRNARKDSMVRKGCDQAVVRIGLAVAGRQVLVELAVRSGTSDALQLNHNAAARGEVARLAPLTIFTPRDIDIIAGPPSERRDFVDSALTVLGPRAAEAVENYDTLLRHRNSVLRQISATNSSSLTEMLDVFDEQLAEAGERLARMRWSLLSRIEPVLSHLYAGISGKNDTISLSYSSTWGQNLREAMTRSRGEDLRRGATSVGPHRDDVAFNLNGLDARYEASQGEQRTLAFSLKMGLHEMVRDRIGEDPIVLLDDVFSELDRSRSDKVLETSRAAQVLVTTSIGDRLDERVKLKLEVCEGALQ